MRKVIPFAVLLLSACDGPSYPASPDPGPLQPVAPTRLHITVSPGELPIGGGSATILIEATGDGYLGAANARVALTSTGGALDAAEALTDATGHAKVGWQGDRTATVRGVLGDLVATADVRVNEPPPPFVPSPAPPPAPPAPPPAPPDPAPAPPAPPPAPAVAVALIANPTSAQLGETITLTAYGTPNSSAGPVTEYRWDFNDDGTTDQTTASSSTTTTYSTIGLKSPRVTARTANGTSGDIATSVAVSGPPLAVGLAASTLAAAAGSTVTFTATVSAGSGTILTPVTYEWDWDGNGTVDEITSDPTTTESAGHVFNNAGTFNVRVRARAADGRAAENTVAVVVATD